VKEKLGEWGCIVETEQQMPAVVSSLRPCRLGEGEQNSPIDRKIFCHYDVSPPRYR
jgi:hypothetical protein